MSDLISSGQKVEIWKREFVVSTKRDEVVLVIPELLPYIDQICWDAVDVIPRSDESATVQFASSQSHVSRGPILVWKKNDFALAIRSYKRGGFVQRLLKDKFFIWPWQACWTKVCNKSLQANISQMPSLGRFYVSRCYRELEILSYLFSSGVSVPAPIVARVIFDGRGFYRAWIATEFVSNAISVFDFANANDTREEQLFLLALQVGKEVRKMLNEGVYHSDFHPGNVIICGDDKIVLLDFDKAIHFCVRPDKEKYADKLISRWTRAVSKYGLNIALVTGLREGID